MANRIDRPGTANMRALGGTIALRLPYMVSWSGSLVRLADGAGRDHRRGARGAESARNPRIELITHGERRHPLDGLAEADDCGAEPRARRIADRRGAPIRDQQRTGVYVAAYVAGGAA
jgi:hypothetical protein